MRLIAVMPDQTQVSFLVDSLRNIGFERDNLIISDLADDQTWSSPAEAADELAFLQTEREGLWEIGTFASGIKGLRQEQGILVAVETPKHQANTVRILMKQNGASQVIQD